MAISAEGKKTGEALMDWVGKRGESRREQGQKERINTNELCNLTISVCNEAGEEGGGERLRKEGKEVKETIKGASVYVVVWPELVLQSPFSLQQVVRSGKSVPESSLSGSTLAPLLW